MPKRTYSDKSNEPFKQMYIPEYNMYTDATFGGDDYRAISPRWKELRKKRLQMDDFKCARCGTAMNLDVHHINYPPAWGLEKIDDLITLCHSCHASIHRKENN